VFASEAKQSHSTRFIDEIASAAPPNDRFYSKKPEQLQRKGAIMVRKFYLCLLAGLLVTSSTSFAQQESWYWGFGLGPGLSTYSGDLGTSVSNLSSKSSIGLAGDLAFYFPVADGKTVIG
jgi:hypothetical protein